MKKSNYLVLLLTLIVSLSLQAQEINSPYSRFGLGLLHGENVNTSLMGMGGIAIGVSDPTMVNPGNAASYAVFDSTTFVFDIGLTGNLTTLKTSLQSESSSFVTLSYIMFGFPITKWWKSSLGMLPFSKIGYDVKIFIPVDKFSNVINEIEGDGGLNQFFWGNAFKINENLRLGIDAAFIFGQGSRSSKVYFPDSLYIFGTKTINHTRGSDFIFDYGIQYDFNFSNTRKLTLGAIYSNNWKLNVKREYLANTFTGGYGDVVETLQDTVAYTPEEKGTLTIPQRFGLGFTYQEKERWLIGADFEWQNWEEYTAFGISDSLDNAWRIAIGGQYSPKHTSISSLAKRMYYRLGIRYTNSYLSIFGKPINEYGISFGLTFPLKKSRTAIDLGIEYGRRGTTDNNLIQENFLNFSLGFSIHEHWFHKRKYQ
ncbi:MAG: hypothetical protein V2I62_14360 [Bacteroidales bacterium]|jgi:long-subunit fatty acid transport protein|nr:hypothetical protein [Bacteroidales bacterium]